MRSCSIADCARRHKGHGYCDMHLARWKRTGDPMVAGPRGRRAERPGQFASDPVTRIDRYLVRRGADECWGWTGNTTKDGYPILADFRTGRMANAYVHRLAHEMHIGPIPDGYEVDHLCFNPECTNPRHLEAVTLAENRRRQRVGHAADGRFVAQVA